MGRTVHGAIAAFLAAAFLVLVPGLSHADGEKADLNGCNPEQYDPATPYPKINPVSGKVGLIGKQCQDTTNGFTTTGTCVGADVCKATPPGGLPTMQQLEPQGQAFSQPAAPELTGASNLQPSLMQTNTAAPESLQSNPVQATPASFPVTQMPVDTPPSPDVTDAPASEQISPTAPNPSPQASGFQGPVFNETTGEWEGGAPGAYLDNRSLASPLLSGDPNGLGPGSVQNEGEMEGNSFTKPDVPTFNTPQLQMPPSTFNNAVGAQPPLPPEFQPVTAAPTQQNFFSQATSGISGWAQSEWTYLKGLF